jgi:ATP-dependent 26S proteasome regulatory subunit
MNAPFPRQTLPPGLAGIPPTAEAHLRLGLFAVAAQLIEGCAGGNRQTAFAGFPFLVEYQAEIAALLGHSEPSAAEFRTALRQWEAVAGDECRLPLLALGRAAIDPLGQELLLAAGLIEEDPRFGELFEHATGRDRRPTNGLLLGWWLGPAGSERDLPKLRSALRQLHRTGLVTHASQAGPRSEWPLTVPAPVWDVLQGQPPELDGIRHVPSEHLLPLEDFIGTGPAGRLYQAVPRLLRADPGRLLIVRGPKGNGRRTLIGAIARELGHGMLLGDANAIADPARWRSFAALAVLLGAMPVIDLPLGPGENRMLPPVGFADLPIGVITGLRGGVATEDTTGLLTIELGLPDAPARRSLWQRTAPGQDDVALDRLAASIRLGSGAISRVAREAAAAAALDGRHTILPADAASSARVLGAPRLEAAAARIDARGSLGDLALDDATRNELQLLTSHCRHRERLALAPFDPATTAGVKALFAGPSGTGKTLAARLIAAELGKDLYRIDLAAAVNKYIGETEKNLDAAFAAAEESDIVLLLDEGDALMTARTDVSSSNDRYANLETNFLLQRIEQYSGILLVTTNAVDRIDRAFARRMDVVIHFRSPDEHRRYEILRLHLGPHELEDAVLQEIAWRCALTGGQIRNVVQHARVLALDAERDMSGDDLRSAVHREYRKTGAQCPLKPAGAVG